MVRKGKAWTMVMVVLLTKYPLHASVVLGTWK